MAPQQLVYWMSGGLAVIGGATLLSLALISSAPAPTRSLSPVATVAAAPAVFATEAARSPSPAATGGGASNRTTVATQTGGGAAPVAATASPAASATPVSPTAAAATPTASAAATLTPTSTRAATVVPASPAPVPAAVTVATPTRPPPPPPRPPRPGATPHLAGGAAGAAGITIPDDRPRVKVLEVITGETIEVEDETGQPQIVEVLGLTTLLESAGPRAAQCVSADARARARARELLAGQTVWLETDASQEEPIAAIRPPRYLWLPDGRLFNLEMIDQGFGLAVAGSPPYRYQPVFQAAEQRARAAELGIWSPARCGERLTR